MEKVRQLEVKIIRYTAVLVAVLVLFASLILRNIPIVMGLIFGSLIAVLNFIELSRTLQRAVHKKMAAASAYTTFKYFIRFAIMAVALYVAATNDAISLFGAIIGLLSVKVVVYATHLLNDRSYFKKILKRKEE